MAAEEWPIEPDAGMAPATEKQDVLATLDHVATLLNGAANWLDHVDAPTAEAWNTIATAKEHVESVRRALTGTWTQET